MGRSRTGLAHHAAVGGEERNEGLPRERYPRCEHVIRANAPTQAA
jgi:hypothetical protein